MRRSPESDVSRTAQYSGPPEGLCHVLQHRESRYERLGKPLLDRLIAAVALIVLAPVLLAVAIALRVRLGSPVLLRQARVGRNGRVFEMLKFRTMHADRRQQSVPFGSVDRRVCHKSDNDPRHTRIGRFLRKWSLDELPQFWNVLHGEMSLVGPRPELVQIVRTTYAPHHHYRHRVLPGITGPWQVSRRGTGLMHNHVELDLAYVQGGISLSNDVAILLRTVGAVLFRRTGS